MANLDGKTVAVFGRNAPLYAWPVVQVGVGPDGSPAPVLVDADGNLKVAASVTTSQNGASNFAVTNITAASDGSATLAARPARRSVSILCLDDSAETIYYGPAPGVNDSTGARLKAGQSQAVDTTTALFFFGEAGTGTIQCVETYD